MGMRATAGMVLGAALLLGCGAGPVDAVELRASSDFFCPNNKIEIDTSGECTYEARGCGRKASYLVEPREEGASGCCPAPGCRAYRQGAVKGLDGRSFPDKPSEEPPNKSSEDAPDDEASKSKSKKSASDDDESD